MAIDHSVKHYRLSIILYKLSVSVPKDTPGCLTNCTLHILKLTSQPLLLLLLVLILLLLLLLLLSTMPADAGGGAGIYIAASTTTLLPHLPPPPPPPAAAAAAAAATTMSAAAATTLPASTYSLLRCPVTADAGSIAQPQARSAGGHVRGTQSYS